MNTPLSLLRAVYLDARETFISYKEVIKEAQAPARTALLLTVFTGLIEGSAIMALIPILSGVTQAPSSALESSPPSVYLGIALFLALGMAFAVLNYRSTVAMAKVEFYVMSSTMARAASAILLGPWEKVVELKGGELHKTLLLEAQRIGLGSRQTLSALSQVLVAGIMFLLCLLISWEMTAVTVVFSLFGTFAYLLLGLGTQKQASALASVEAALADEIGEAFQGLKLFRLSGLIELIRGALKERFSAYAGTHVAVQRSQAAVRCVAEGGVIVFLTTSLLLGVVALHTPPARLLIFLAIFYRMAPRILHANALLISARVELRMLRAWRHRIGSLRGALEDNGKRASPPFSAIRIDSLTLVVPSRATPILNSVTFTLTRGTWIALVGPSGSGKSTLVDCIAGLYPGVAPTIYLDDLPLSEISLLTWQRGIAIVQQKNHMLYGSIKSNVSFGDPTPDLSRISSALERAHADEFLSELPHGIDTIIGRGGHPLSGGQEQRIALARALYRQPELLIVDEPTSALDAASAGHIISTFRELRGGTTILMVTHQLREIRDADFIHVMEGGRIVESGSWDTLMKEGSVLKELAAKQLIEG